MRTTIRMEAALLADAERHARGTGRSLTRLIQHAVIAQLERERGRHAPRSVSLPVFGGDGLRPGIDLDDSAGLLDAMESPTKRPSS